MSFTRRSARAFLFSGRFLTLLIAAGICAAVLQQRVPSFSHACAIAELLIGTLLIATGVAELLDRL